MKFKCCNNLINTLVFAQADVMACCCSRNHKFIKFFKQSDNKEFDINGYTNIRTEYIDAFKRNEIPEGCIDCPFIKEYDWNENIEITNIIISNRTKCSCNCIYCSLLEGDDSGIKRKELNTRDVYDVKPILQALKDKNYVKSGCNIQIAGGEPSEYPDNELEWLLNFASELKCNIEVLSSAINFSKALEKSLKTESIKLLISPDSGTKQMYEKIKRVNKYNEVWANIKKYTNAANKNKKAEIYLKYILLPEINDNLEEISLFIKKCESVKCTNIVASIDFNWLEKNRDKYISNNLRGAVKYFLNLSLNNNSKIKVSFEPQVEYWFKQNGI